MLRPVQNDDTPFLFELYGSTRAEELAAWAFAPPQRDAFLKMQWSAQRQSYAAQFPQAEHSMVVVGDRPVGRLLVDRNPREIRLVDVALLPAHRRGGIGSALIRTLQDEARGSARPLRLHVRSDNPQAARLYARLGFTVLAQDELGAEMEWRADVH